MTESTDVIPALRRLSRAASAIAVALMVLLTNPSTVFAQSANDRETIAEATRLRDSRQFATAIALLRRHLADHPDDVTAARLLAETLYWNGQVVAARTAYEEAERRHPDNAVLRLAHARMLAQLNEQAAATERLLALRAIAATAGEAEALLGTLAHWRGDLTAAQAHFRAALRLLPGRADAERGLSDIRETTAPWVHTRVRLYDDDQPLTRATVATSAGAYLTPLRAVLVETEIDRFTTDGLRTGGSALGVLRAYWPRVRLQTEFAGGARQGAPGNRSEWLGRAKLGFRLASRVTASVAAQREPYLNTFASTLQPVMIATAEGGLDWETSTGWLGQLGLRRVSYPDANSGESMSGWVLAPLVRRERFQIRGGYAYGWDDTQESRFEPIVVSASARPSPRQKPAVGGSILGFYTPYFTPLDAHSHSVAGTVSLQTTPRIAFRLNGSYAFYARETAPFFYYDAGDTSGSLIIRSGFYRRRYTPVNGRAAIEAALRRGLSLQLELEHRRGSFWRGTQINIGLLYRFLPATSTR